MGRWSEVTGPGDAGAFLTGQIEQADALYRRSGSTDLERRLQALEPSPPNTAS